MQMKRLSWTNASSAVALNFEVGFEVAQIEIWDQTTPNRFEWTKDMADASFFTLGTLAFTTTNGVTPLLQETAIGASISAFTNAAPGVLTVTDTAIFGYAAGDTITVSNLADDGSSASSLDGDFTIASVTATTITLVESTVGFSVYVSGGIAVRKTDTNGDAVAQENKAIRGITLGTGAVGANSAVMNAVCYSEDPVT